MLSFIQNYFGDAWNVFDFIVVLGSFIDIIISDVDKLCTDSKCGDSNKTPNSEKVKNSALITRKNNNSN